MISVEECCAAEARSLDYYLVNSDEALLQDVARIEGLKRENIEGKENYKSRIEREKLEHFEHMQLHGQFERQTKEDKTELSWNWLQSGNMKRETESLLVAAQEQALNTNSVKRIYDKKVSNKCRLCGSQVENVLHIVSGCSVLAQKEYKRRHDTVAKTLHWKICKEYDMSCSEKWYNYTPEKVVENDRAKILWD